MNYYFNINKIKSISNEFTEDYLHFQENYDLSSFDIDENDFDNYDSFEKIQKRKIEKNPEAKNERPEKAPKPVKKAPPPGLSRNAAEIYSVLDRTPKSSAEISDLTNLASSAVAVGLTELELLGLILPVSGRRFVIA